MPCADIKGAGNTTELIKSAQDQQNSQHSDADACSPFCTCSCCASVNFKMPHIAVTKVAFGSPSKDATFISSEIVDISLPIWQPPQLKA